MSFSDFQGSSPRGYQKSMEMRSLKDTDLLKNASVCIWPPWDIFSGFQLQHTHHSRGLRIQLESEVSLPVHSYSSALTDQLRACVQIKGGEFESLASWEIKGQRVYQHYQAWIAQIHGKEQWPGTPSDTAIPSAEPWRIFPLPCVIPLPSVCASLLLWEELVCGR